MTKIVLAGSFNFTDEQKLRLAAVGDVTVSTNIASDEAWLEAVDGADVVCSDGSFLYANLSKLKNVFATYPYTELGTFNSDELAAKGVYVANAQGGNRKSIAEWAMFTILSLFRGFPTYLRTTEQYPFTATESLEGKKVVIVGHGTIGTEVGERCLAFGMDVDYFERGEDLKAKIKDADLVINALNCNESTRNLLDASFFSSMKKGSYFVTFSRPYTYDIDGLISSIDSGVIAGAGIDCDPEPLFDITNDFYKKCMSNKKILVTPHVAGITKQAGRNGTEIMVKNVEMYLAGKSQNILKK
jgi:phosphoglycerate dehydrogenase-like enzyme